MADGRHLGWKNRKNSYISETVWQIGMKLGMVTHWLTVNRIESWNLLKSKMAEMEIRRTLGLSDAKKLTEDVIKLKPFGKS